MSRPLRTRVFWRPEAQAPRVVGFVWAAMGPLILLVAAIDVATGGDDGRGFVAAAVLLSGVGAALVAGFKPPERVNLSGLFMSVGAGALAATVGAALPYLTTGTLSSPDEALFEAVSGVTTTAMTVIDVDRAGAGVLAWRAVSQWLGGLGALLLVVAVLPFLGHTDAARSRPRLTLTSVALVRRVQTTLRPMLAVYGGFTVVVAFAYWLAGMGRFDAFVHGLTTVSTGGWSTRSGSIGAFDSAAVEWVAAAAMVAAGVSIIWWINLFRERRLRLPSAAELKWYLIMVAVGTAAVATQLDAPDGVTLVRRSLFTVASFASTTGFVVEGVASWTPGIQAIVLVAMGVGAMHHSVSGGFKVERAAALVAFVRREIIEQLHPQAVVAVKVGKKAMSDDLVDRMLGYQAVFIGLAGLTLVGVAATSVDILTSVWLAMSAVSNTGFVIGADAAGSMADFGVGARTVVGVAALIGRVEVYPAVIALSSAVQTADLRRRRRALITRMADR